MEFDTGNRPDPSGSGGSGGGTGMRPPGASAGGEFDYRDPVQSFVNVVRNLVTAPVGFFRGLAGHSDADVVAHAVAEAMLGAGARVVLITDQWLSPIERVA